jgi:DNA-binding protein YbaB
MSFETQTEHPQVSEALEQLQKFSTLLEDQMSRSDTGSFTATDEDETVTATINGHHLLTGLFIEEGLMRLGAETVEQRINEAVRTAQAQATAAITGQQEELIASLFEITGNLAKAVGFQPESNPGSVNGHDGSSGGAEM